MILMSNGADGNNNNNNDTAIWTTWEELLLAFAVKRHGLDDWETVAMELQNRHRSSSVFTPENCRDQYKTLRRRFENQEANIHENAAAAAVCDSDGDNGFGESFAWLEELRQLRVAELKQEVQRYDLSIESLQKKAKTLEEERKSSNENSVSIPDLDNNQIKEERSENDKTAAGQVDTPRATGKTVSCEDENRSCHESNSTENRQAGLKVEPELEGGIKQDPESLNPPVEDEEDSCDDSSDRRHELVGKESQEVAVNEGDDSAELADDSKEGSQGTKETSDVQSSASLITRKYRAGELDGGGGGGGATTTTTTTLVGIKRERQGAVESEPLYGVLDNIWSQKHGSMFGHRLESQKTERYKKMIRQHVDLETVQSRIEDGLYSSCPAKFYVDLLLLVNNANVFFPKSSPESLAARELRRLVMKELKNSSAPPSSFGQPSSPRPQTKPDPGKSDSMLAKHKSTTPLIVCKKRSSISGKASSSSGNNNKAEEQDEDKPSSIPKPSVKSPLMSTSNEEEDGASKIKAKEKPVTTGVRSMRRGSSSKGRASVSSSVSGPIEKPISRSMPPLDNTTTDKAEASKVDKKKGGPK